MLLNILIFSHLQQQETSTVFPSAPTREDEPMLNFTNDTTNNNNNENKTLQTRIVDNKIIIAVFGITLLFLFFCLNSNYLYIPVRIICYPWKSGKKLNWSVSGGMEFQYSLFSWQNLRRIGEVSKLRVDGNNFNMQDKQVAVNFRFALKRIAFYADYGLIPLFNPTQQMYHYMPEYNTIHFGVCFNGF